VFEVRPNGDLATDTTRTAGQLFGEDQGRAPLPFMGSVRGCSLKTEEREPKASAGGISALSAAVSTVKKHIHKRRASSLWDGERCQCGGATSHWLSDFWEGLRADL